MLPFAEGTVGRFRKRSGTELRSWARRLTVSLIVATRRPPAGWEWSSAVHFAHGVKNDRLDRSIRLVRKKTGGLVRLHPGQALRNDLEMGTGAPNLAAQCLARGLGHRIFAQAFGTPGIGNVDGGRIEHADSTRRRSS